MAFKNLLSPNQASGGRFLQSYIGVGRYDIASFVYSTTNPYNGEGCVKYTTTGSSQQGLFATSPTALNTSNNYSLAWKIWVDAAVTFKIQFGGNSGVNVPTSAGLNVIKYENHPPVSNRYLYLTTSQACNFYYLRGQLELGPVCTPYEFPGIDLTGNSITSNEAVQNIKLNQQLKLFTIASQEQVQNLTVENILQLLQVPSSEYVNNLEICNSIFLEAIESTETVNEFIAWVACEFIKCNITMKTPKTILKMKYPR